MADLSPEQLSFLETHLGFSTKSYLKRRTLKAQLQDFWRRRDKAESQLKDLPEDHPQRATLQAAIAAATKKAETGDLKGAYNDLKQTKEQAKAAAKVARDGANLATIQGDLAVLETLVRRLRYEQSRIRDYARDQAQALIDEATRLPDPAGANGPEKIVEIVSENYRDKQHILSEWDEMATNVEQDVQTYRSILSNVPTASDLTKTIAHNIALLNKQKPEAAKLPHNARFMAANQAVRDHHLGGNGAELKDEIDKLMSTRRERLLDTLAQRTRPPGMEKSQMTGDDGTPLTGQAAEEMLAKMAERFKLAEDREKKRLEAAKRAYREALLEDAAFLGSTEDNTLIRGARLRGFDTADLFEEAGIDLTNNSQPPDEAAAAAGRALRDCFDKLMNDAGGIIPDEVFEMCSRSDADWYAEAAKSAGIVFDPKDPSALDPLLWAKIRAAGDEMRLAAREKYPNKAKFDGPEPTEVEIGGVTYKDFKFLGGGGGGEVWKGRDPQTGNEVVLKMPLGFAGDDKADPEAHAEFAAEAANHRAASGGEHDPCPENILDFKGMVLAPNGMPLLAMDLADAGDAGAYTSAMRACEDSGLISDQAKQAMMTVQMRDVVKGMQAMQRAGMTHHDLKEANVFMTSDGVFKVADFGLARHVDSHTASSGEVKDFSSGYQPPELKGEGEMTQKSDNFTLGEILDRITDPYGGATDFRSQFMDMNAAHDQKKDGQGKVIATSSLDRLVNRLKDPDPAKRPTLAAVLQSSFLNELEKSYTPEAMDRLRKASANYAKTVGRETSRIAEMASGLEADIIDLELSKSDALAQKKIDHYQRTIREREAGIRDQERLLAVEWDETRRAAIQKKIDKFKEDKAQCEQSVQRHRAEQGKAKSALEIEKIDKQIEGRRQALIDLRKQIAAVHQKAEYRDVIAELEAANKAFV